MPKELGCGLHRSDLLRQRQVAPVSEGNLIKLRVPVLSAVEGSLAVGDRGGRGLSAEQPTGVKSKFLLRPFGMTESHALITKHRHKASVFPRLLVPSP